MQPAQLKKRYRIFDHLADLGVEVNGDNLNQLFENAAQVLFHLITDLNKIRSTITRQIILQSTDRELLFREWLGELLAIFHTEGYLFSTFEITMLSDKKLTAKVSGDKYIADRHPLKREIKAVTYHALRIECEHKGCRARFILDV